MKFMNRRALNRKIGFIPLILFVIIGSGIFYAMYVPGSTGTSYACENAKEEIQCWADLIEKTVKEDGVDDAFDIIEKLYAHNTLFTSDNCHSYVHIVGEEAYLLYASENLLILSPKTSLCDYGFYHGFMERLVQATGSLKDAREFCNYVKGQLIGYGGSCFHGIGHGMADSHDPRVAQDPKARIVPVLALCKEISDIERERESCFEGVFNEIASVFVLEEDEISLDRNKPLAFCRIFIDPTLLHICYREFAKATLSHITEIDFLQSIKFISDENIKDDVSAKKVVRAMASTFVLDAPRFNITEGFSICATIEERLRDACTTGLRDGLILYGDASG